MTAGGGVDFSAVWGWIEDELTRPADGWAVDARDMQPVYELRAVIADLIDSHARLLAMARRHGLPKVADDLAPIAEARRIIAVLESATARRASALAALEQQS